MSKIQRYITLALSLFLLIAGIRMLSAHGGFNAQLMYIIAGALLLIDSALYAVSILLPYDKSKFLVYLYLLFIMANLVATITDQVGWIDGIFFGVNLFLGYLHIKSQMK